MLAPDPQYDLHAAFYLFAPGVVLTPAIEVALAAQYATNAYTPLTQAQVVAIAAPLPVYPPGMPRFLESNPASFDNWAIDNQQVNNPP